MSLITIFYCVIFKYILIINKYQVHRIGLSKNPNAIHLLEKNKDKIDWYWLSYNPNVMMLLEKNININCFIIEYQ